MSDKAPETTDSPGSAPEQIQEILNHFDFERMAWAYAKIQGEVGTGSEAGEKQFDPRKILSYSVNEVLCTLGRAGIQVTPKNAVQVAAEIRKKIQESRADELLAIPKLGREVQVLVYRHMVYSDLSRQPQLSPEDHFEKLIIESIADDESHDGTEKIVSDFFGKNVTDPYVSYRVRLGASKDQRHDLNLRRSAGSWPHIPEPLTDEVAVSRPALEASIRWEKDYRNPDYFYEAVYARIARWALEQFSSAKEMQAAAAIFQPYCRNRLLPIYESLLLHPDYLEAYRNQIMTDEDRSQELSFSTGEQFIDYLVEEVFEDFFKHQEIEAALETAARNRIHEQLTELIPGFSSSKIPSE